MNQAKNEKGSFEKIQQNSKKGSVPKEKKIQETLEKTFLQERSLSLIPLLKKEFSLKNIMEVPQLDKIVINFCLGSFLKKGGDFDNAFEMLTLIAGQKPIAVKSKCSVANFKLREGTVNALKVTLRKKKMYWFLERLLYIALPRTYNFWGLKETAHDGRKSFAIGLNDLSVFPEIGSRFSMKGAGGLNITLTMKTKSIQQGLSYLKQMDVPFIQAKTL